MPLCTVEDIADLISLDGVIQASTDGDDGDSVNDPAVDNAIERGEQILKQYISGRYDTASLTTNKWAKWACALIAAVQLFRRRGNPLAPGLQESWDELKEQLELIRDGVGEVPDGQPRIEPGIAMSNLRYDARYPTQKMRAQTAISAGQQDSTKPRRTDPLDSIIMNP